DPPANPLAPICSPPPPPKCPPPPPPPPPPRANASAETPALPTAMAATRNAILCFMPFLIDLPFYPIRPRQLLCRNPGCRDVESCEFPVPVDCAFSLEPDHQTEGKSFGSSGPAALPAGATLSLRTVSA